MQQSFDSLVRRFYMKCLCDFISVSQRFSELVLWDVSTLKAGLVLLLLFFFFVSFSRDITAQWSGCCFSSRLLPLRQKTETFSEWRIFISHLIYGWWHEQTAAQESQKICIEINFQNCLKLSSAPRQWFHGTIHIKWEKFLSFSSSYLFFLFFFFFFVLSFFWVTANFFFFSLLPLLLLGHSQ